MTFQTPTDPLEQKTFKKLKSDTGFCYYGEQNDGEENASLEVTEADATFVQMAERSADNYDCALEGIVTPKRYKDELSKSGGMQDERVQKTQIMISAESPNSISSYDKNKITGMAGPQEM